MRGFTVVLALLPLLPTGNASAPGVLTIAGDHTGLHREVVREVADRYITAELDLPPVQISFPDDPEACRGSIARHRRTRSGSAVEVCEQPAEQPVQFRHAVAHELAHAWIASHVTGADRARFLTHRGLSVWSGPAAEWRQRGIEHGAEIITWAVLRHPILLVRIPDKSCARLRAAHVVLTGQAPIPDLEECRTR